jgi:hypothetical protein
LVSLAKENAAKKDQQRLLARVPAIAMLSQQTANIPAWCIADTSPNEWTILQRAIGFGKLDTNETSTTTDEEAPATRYDQYPLAMAASGRVVLKGRRWSRINKGHAFKVLLVLVAAAAFAIIVLQRDLGTSNQLQDCREIPGVKGSQDAPNVKSRRIGTGLANVISQPPTQKLSALALSPAEMAFERTVLAFVHQKTATLERRVQMAAQALLLKPLTVALTQVQPTLEVAVLAPVRKNVTRMGQRIADIDLAELLSKIGRRVKQLTVALAKVNDTLESAVLTPVRETVPRIGRRITDIDLAPFLSKIGQRIGGGVAKVGDLVSGISTNVARLLSAGTIGRFRGDAAKIKLHIANVRKAVVSNGQSRADVVVAKLRTVFDELKTVMASSQRSVWRKSRPIS